jgi:transcription antitermination factor NusG
MNAHATCEPDPTQEKWHVAFTQPQCERRAIAHLPRCVTPYWPMFFARMRGRGNMVRKVERPMFPGYLFLRFGLETPHWHRIFTSPGLRPINTLMVINGHYVTLPEDEMAKIGRTENSLRLQDNLPAKLMPFNVGDTVRIEEGAFVGFNGEFTDLDDQGRCGVLLAMLGRMTRVYLPAEHLSPV